MNEVNKSKVAYYVTRFINGTNQAVFLTGKAGTGKTTLLKQIVETTHKKTLIAAPTGIAAINAGGITLHSLFHLPFGSFIPENTIPGQGNYSFQITTPKTLIRNLKMNSKKKALIREMELLIIDEVSMLRADLLDAIDTILRYVRRSSKAFGGLQILFIGDLWQLPPVVKNAEWNIIKNYYSNVFFFNANVFKQRDLIYLELEKIFRQTDSKFIDLLNNFRLNKISQTDIDILNKQYVKNFKLFDNEGYIYLTTHNYKANEINKKALAKLPGVSYHFDAEVIGDYSEYSYPVDLSLELKLGAQVMFIKNDYSGKQAYFNGKIGKIDDISDDNIRVSFTDGTPSAEVEKYTWENKKFALNSTTKEIEENIVGKFEHYPLKLAWAITIHKSQGLTFEKAVIDISQSFAGGQIYVALSRLTSLKGLVLAEPVSISGPKIDKDLAIFAESKISSDDAEKKYKSASKEYVNSKIVDAFNFNALIFALREHIETYNKDKKKSAKQKYLSWAEDLHKNTHSLVEVSRKFQNQVKSIVTKNENDYLLVLNERLIAAKDYFVPLLKDKQEEIEKHISEVKKEKGVKKYLKELKALQGDFYNRIIAIYKAEALCSAVINNEDIDNSKFQSITENIQKPEDEVKTKSPKGKKKKGEPKVKTSQITYELYKQGKTIEEIAKERQLVLTTIEGHLATCIKEGKISVNKFLVSERVDEIIYAAEELDTDMLTPIKNHLDDEFSYSEIKFAMAHMKYKNNEE
ncbi:MAG: helix-turn-helix domain-containing protein [Bacteroidota bacterium]|nr:helix-turn-helix domain-containing protein [Bacteroidota bacterium]